MSAPIDSMPDGVAEDLDSTVFVEQIVVLMRINTPGAKAPIELTSDVLVLPDAMTATDRGMLNKYPYFTMSRLYPRTYLASLKYEQQIKFFFDENRFTQVLRDHGSDEPCDDMNMDATELEAVYDRSDAEDTRKLRELSISVCNAELMLTLLFPTVFPRLDDNATSFAQYIQGRSNARVTLRGAIPSMFESTLFNTAKRFSYVRVGGKVCTVAKTTWLNDFVNHPVYQQMAEEYKKFNLWRVQMRNVLDKEMYSQRKQIVTAIARADALAAVRADVDGAAEALRALAASMTDRQNMQKIDTYTTELERLLKNFFGVEYIPPDGTTASERVEEDNDEALAYVDLGEPEQIAGVDHKIALLGRIESYLEMVRAAAPGFRLPALVAQKITTATGLRAKLVTAQNLVTNYFALNINSNFADDPSVSDTDKSGRLAPYRAYIDHLRNYMYPLRTMSNDRVQDLIANFATNVDQDFGKYMRYVVQRFFMNNKKVRFPYASSTSDRRSYFSRFSSTHPTTPIFVGLCRRERELVKYEMHVQVDVVGEKITSENLRTFACDYKNASLGDRWVKYMNAPIYMNEWRVNPAAFYYELPKKGSVSTEIPVSLIDVGTSDTNATPSAPVSKETKGGFARTRRAGMRKKKGRARLSRRARSRRRVGRATTWL